jgi:DUF1009 family protein
MAARTNSIGLIAGSGKLPFLFSRAARQQGRRVLAVGFRGETSPTLAGQVDELAWVRVGQLGGLLKQFKKWGVKRAYMQGKVQHRKLYQVRPDLKAIAVIAKLAERSGTAIMAAVANELKKQGVGMGDCRDYLEECLVKKGLHAGKKYDAALAADIKLGQRTARLLADNRLGQSVAVKNGAVVALEAMEGTDALVRRAVKLAGKGLVIVKCAGEKHDYRFDVPTVGTATLNLLEKSRVACLALEAGRTFIIDRDKFLARAGKSGLRLVAF